MTHLRPYQEQALDAFWTRLADTDEPANRLAIEMATGLGKSVVGAAAAAQWLGKAEPGQRVLFIAHTDEIIDQLIAKVRIFAPGWTVGKVKAESNETTADIVVASVQTLANPDRRAQITDVGFMIIDEAHHSIATTYVQIMEHFGAMPRYHAYAGVREGLIPTLGLTATLARSDGAGLGHVWQDLAFSRSTTWAQRKGFLVDLIPYTIRIPEITATASDSRLDQMLVDSIAPEKVVEAWLLNRNGPGGEHGPAPSTVLFAPGVASAREFAETFQEAGIKSEVVHGAMPAIERRAILERYEQGVTTVLCNAMVLTEGWDAPRTKCVIVARPTKSVPLFVQMVGRGLRPWIGPDAPAREDQRCILLSVADAVNSLASVADLSDRPLEVQDGKSLLTMEDEWDIGAGIEDKPERWVGPVRVEQWDEMVTRSSKAWKYTRDGHPFLPTAKRGEGYVFIVGTDVFAYTPAGARRVASAPDLELAMGLAEDEAMERGGDIGRLIADKGRAWRKAVPSEEMIAYAKSLGLAGEVDRIMASRAGGKAGKLSDLIDRVVASRRLDSIAKKIKERVSA